MRSEKRYTNSTFTKRVDHQAGRHRGPRGLREPLVCVECGAFYARKRWIPVDPSSIEKPQTDSQVPQTILCPACAQQRKGEPRGFVFLDGTFFGAHYEEVERLLRNEAQRAIEDNPLGRIMEWKRGGGHKLTVTTTTEHLAQRLGDALQKAYGGTTQYDFSHENKLARVSWQRE